MIADFMGVVYTTAGLGVASPSALFSGLQGERPGEIVGLERARTTHGEE
jgi:hypothetical protein